MDNLSRLRLFVLFVVLMVVLAAVGVFVSQAQTEHTVYVPYVEHGTCMGCEPRQTPTPTRLWQPWGYPIE